ncbi:hypothetical protein [Desulfosporosinus sp.]|uniref:hypothetical protein n=1 Tax=Desulfosporosinus sp. TaxID=157907 RepID=UPI0025C2A61E|nr:hypothetical protein [Desulfosporosinus sp.]MBC2723428.1 hypothetical protein [Desulfosporosinus sp.]MBC2726844.1 hypothetical protein [Desulfosporosinus sp.]
MNERFKKDTLLIGAVAGTIAKVIQDAIGFIIITFFLPTYINCVRIAGGLLLTPNEMMSGGFWPSLLGFQIDLIVSIVVGIISVLILQHWGHDYYLFKGAMIGLVCWVLLYIVLSKLLSSVYPFGSILHAEISFIKHITYGIVLTWVAVWFGKLSDNRV